MKLLSADQLASQLDDKPTELHRRSWAHLTDRAKRWVAKQLQRTVPSLESQLQLAEQAQEGPAQPGRPSAQGTTERRAVKRAASDSSSGGNTAASAPQPSASEPQAASASSNLAAQADGSSGSMGAMPAPQPAAQPPARPRNPKDVNQVKAFLEEHHRWQQAALAAVEMAAVEMDAETAAPAPQPAPSGSGSDGGSGTGGGRTTAVDSALAAALASGSGNGGSSSGITAGARILGAELAAAEASAKRHKPGQRYEVMRGDASNLTIAQSPAQLSTVCWIQQRWEEGMEATSGLADAERMAELDRRLGQLPLGPGGRVAGTPEMWVAWASRAIAARCGKRLYLQQPENQPKGAEFLVVAECDKEDVDVLSASPSLTSRKKHDVLLRTNELFEDNYIFMNLSDRCCYEKGTKLCYASHRSALEDDKLDTRLYVDICESMWRKRIPFLKALVTVGVKSGSRLIDPTCGSIRMPYNCLFEQGAPAFATDHYAQHSRMKGLDSPAGHLSLAKWLRAYGEVSMRLNPGLELPSESARLNMVLAALGLPQVADFPMQPESAPGCACCGSLVFNGPPSLPQTALRTLVVGSNQADFCWRDYKRIADMTRVNGLSYEDALQQAKELKDVAVLPCGMGGIRGSLPKGAKCTLCGPKVKAAQRLRSMNCPEVFVCASCQARIGVWVKGGLLVKFQ